MLKYSPTTNNKVTSNNRLSKAGIAIWFICTIFFLYEFMLRTIVGTFQHPITYDLNLSKLQFSLISSTSYQVIYGLMQIPVGLLIQRIGLKSALTIGIMSCSLATLGFATSHHVWATILFRLLMGFGSSFGFICLLIATFEWMPQRSFALFIGLASFLGTLGPMLSAAPIEALSHVPGFSWRIIFLCLSAIALGLALLSLCFVKNNPNPPQAHSFKLIQPSQSILSILGNIIKQPQAWYIALFCGCSFFAIEYLSENEGQYYLTLHHYSTQYAESMISLSWLCYAISCPILGFVSDRLQRRRLPLLISASFNLLGTSLIVFLPDNPATLTLAFVSLGVGASGSSIAFAMLAEYAKNNEVAIIMGFNNTMIMLICAANAPLLAQALTHLNSGLLLTHRIILNYQIVFSLTILLAILAMFLITFKIQETYCKTQRGTTVIAY